MVLFSKINTENNILYASQYEGKYGNGKLNIYIYIYIYVYISLTLQRGGI